MEKRLWNEAEQESYKALKNKHTMIFQRPSRSVLCDSVPSASRSPRCSLMLQHVESSAQVWRSVCSASLHIFTSSYSESSIAFLSNSLLSPHHTGVIFLITFYPWTYNFFQLSEKEKPLECFLQNMDGLMQIQRTVFPMFNQYISTHHINFLYRNIFCSLCYLLFVMIHT